MKIFSLNLFLLLKQRLKRLAPEQAPHEEPARPAESIINRSGYTMVDQLMGGRKLNMLTSGQIDGRMLDQARMRNKSSKARWHKNKNEQTYNPRELKLDPQLEFYYEELGLNQNVSKTTLGSKPSK